MALRLRKDVQKASYYVWFLGAQEAKGLRGSKVLLPAIPKLLERARIQEPLKVTLQISHKGLKIIQGSTKHFIPHGAITCSMQTDDIVACVLLLYNPATKCPLHVHAYRCDSEATAIALNDQLQILINRPDNQKRFNELESRLGYQSTPSSVPSSEPIPTKPKQVTRRYESPRRFDSSLGSDTGTSTRESECSEEHSPTTGPKSPLAHAGSTKLFDSLAAELRAKLNGNGPPLLLPPRDYDTVHRSQGNLAAIELRRCRNQCIVGNNIKNSKQVVSSRGSSGIGSDLAPSPERHDGQSSSDEDWVNDHQESVIIMPATQTRHKKEEYAKQSKPISTYIYPREPVSTKHQRYQRSSSRENNSSPKGSLNSHEEEVKPVLTKPVPLENRFREVFKMKDYDDRKKYSSDEDRIVVEERHHHQSKGRPQPKYLPEIEPVEVYKKPYIKNGKRDADYRGNKTDKQKYKEITENRYRTASPVHHQEGYKGYRAASPERTKSLKRYESRGKDVEPSHRRDSYREPIDDGYRYRNRSSEPTRYRDNSSPPPLIENYPPHNPYKQHEALPYRESIDKMMKSPVMRYKSFAEDSRYSQPQDPSNNKHSWETRGKRHSSQNGSRHSREISPPDLYRDDSRHHFVQVHAKPHIIDSIPTPESTLQKKSPRDRFQNAKEKFQAMERDRIPDLRKQPEPVKMQRKAINEMFEQRTSRQQYHSNGWSSDEEISRPTRNAYKELPAQPQPYAMDPPGRMLPSKSLGNLVKGYRHSYAEPRNFPRVSGRVGLAAVNPY
ncbi:uncharacterized protein LOC134837737 [Culicoides brevitarsis]|uniref:uncharacterized protein LOC134837737 n=1 Tax=Culicoides brevitarsis TaxID=469753 RepID=UPI00307B3E9D